MKITQSNVVMESERAASTLSANQTLVTDRVWVSDSGKTDSEKSDSQAKGEKGAATMTLSASAIKLSEQLQSQRAEFRNWERIKNQPPNGQPAWERRLNRLLHKPAQAPPADTEEDFKIKMMKRLLESMRAWQEGRKPDYEKLEKAERRSFNFQAQSSQSLSFSLNALSLTPSGGTRVIAGGAGHWEEKVTMSAIFTDREVTSFSTAGKVQTADGRTIDFNLNLEMSREFTRTMGMDYTRKTFCVDPLVINLEGNPASFSDQTFFFDLDGDGKEEELAQLAPGSGFLALDKNHDGKINDGSELFGPQSGDGFKDLAAYDEDGNGWIDENDSVFKDLKIWTKDRFGNDRLLALGEAGVGAIYLGYASTEFSLNRAENNETQGIIRSTGIFLKESGEIGTVQHVDWML